MGVKPVAFFFGVFGVVQKVGFRAWARSTALKLGFVGWIKNDRQNENMVVGAVEGYIRENVRLMSRLLCSRGSRRSKVQDCHIRPYDILKLNYDSFDIIK